MEPWKEHLKHLRGTGRTTRMCHEAVRVACVEHRPVIIWCLTLVHAEQVAGALRSALCDVLVETSCRRVLWGFDFAIGEDRIKIFAASVARDHGNLHEDPSVRGVPGNTEYFADHHLVEVMSPWLIRQWERFR